MRYHDDCYILIKSRYDSKMLCSVQLSKADVASSKKIAVNLYKL